MDNKLYQQLSNGWTYRWHQIIKYMTAPKSMLELSVLILFLVLMNTLLSWCLVWSANMIEADGEDGGDGEMSFEDTVDGREEGGGEM